MSRISAWTPWWGTSLAATLMLVSPHACAALPRPLQSLAALPGQPDRQIRVRLKEREPQLEFRGFDLVFSRGEAVRRGFLGGRVPVIHTNRLTRWKAKCRKGQVELVGSDGEGKLFDAVAWVESPSGFVTVGAGLRLRDSLQIRALPREEGCELVNSVDVEKYLEGLVNSEFSSKWSREAIDAQVIAARTYAYHQMRAARANRAASYDVESSVKDQVYEGVHKEDARAAQSVARTRDLILSADAGGGPIKAFYHSTCGGQTELPTSVWGRGSTGFTRRVPCPYCKVSPRFRWNIEASSAQLKERILGALPASSLPDYVRGGELESVSIAERHPSGRASKLVSKWRWKGMSLRWDFTAVQLRSWVGLSKMLSTWFDLSQMSDGRWKISGRGFGHGVGMCQWGAKVMGEKGQKMADILRHYYPDARLVSMSSARRALASH